MDGSWDVKCKEGWIEIPRSMNASHDTLRFWCHYHLEGKCVINVWNIQFELESDLVIFKLRFGI